MKAGELLDKKRSQGNEGRVLYVNRLVKRGRAGRPMDFRRRRKKGKILPLAEGKGRGGRLKKMDRGKKFRKRPLAKYTSGKGRVLGRVVWGKTLARGKES